MTDEAETAEPLGAGSYDGRKSAVRARSECGVEVKSRSQLPLARRRCFAGTRGPAADLLRPSSGRCGGLRGEDLEQGLQQDDVCNRTTSAGPGGASARSRSP